jgi:hypothetical protein
VNHYRLSRPRELEKEKVMCPNSKRQGIAVMVVLAALVLTMGNAWAQARKTTITCSENAQTGDLTVNFKMNDPPKG